MCRFKHWEGVQVNYQIVVQTQKFKSKKRDWQGNTNLLTAVNGISIEKVLWGTVLCIFDHCSFCHEISLPTAYVVQGKVMFWHASVHPSVCPHLGGGVPRPGPAGGGYPSQVQGGYPYQVQAGGVPQPGPAGGYPDGRLPQPGPAGGYPIGGYPTSGTPHWIWPGGTPTGGYPTSGTLLRSRRRTFLFVE